MDEKIPQIIERFREITQKDCYAIKLVEKKPEILDNKIGGQPYLPVGEEYPKNKAGDNLALLLQVNLKDIDLPGYPKKGILEIFTDAGVDWPCEYAVKYFDEGLEYQTNLPVVDISNYIVTKSYSIKLEKTTDTMSATDYRFVETMAKVIDEVCGVKVKGIFEIEDLFGDKLMEKVYMDLPYSPITIGGYANFTQSDPRDNMKENRDECLFKLDSCEDMKKIHIGDSGILFTLISQKAIEECNFKQAIVDWDCC